MIDLKPRVLINVDKINFPADVAAKLESYAEVFYVSGDFSDLLSEATAIFAGGDKVNEKYLAKAPHLKVVSRFGVGYDTVDVDACTSGGVYVTHTTDVLSEAVADLTWALILGWIRKIPDADRFTRTEWAKRTRSFPFGWDLRDKKLGIVGLGRIGTEVVKRGVGFGVKMNYYDIIRMKDKEKRWGVTYVSFEDLLKTSDIISLHVPLLPTTRGLMGEKEFKLMKPSALVVNTSRGPVIDQKAVTEALKTKRIAGAALDVFEVEPISLDEGLLKMENALVTPHIASATWETRRKMAERCCESIIAFLKGERPPFTVPEQEGVNFQ